MMAKRRHQTPVRRRQPAWPVARVLLPVAIVISVQVAYMFLADRRLFADRIIISAASSSPAAAVAAADLTTARAAATQPSGAVKSTAIKRPQSAADRPVNAAAAPSDRVAAIAPVPVDVVAFDAFDSVAPPVVRGVTHLPASLPSKHRIPTEFLRNTSAYFAGWSSEQSPDTFMVYNPSVVPLPSAARDDLPSYFGGTNDDPRHRPVYLASYRLSSVHSCGFPTYAFWDHPRNVFALALLDADLNIVPASDVVVDLNGHFDRQAKFEDLRLFGFDDVVYLSSFTTLVPIRVSSPGSAGLAKGETVIPPMYGDGLVVTLRSEPATVETRGKNFQFFRPDGYGAATDGSGGESGSGAKVLMEAWPASPRVILELDFKGLVGVGRRTVPTMREIQSDETPPPADATLDQAIGKRFTARDRGTACCVRIDREHFPAFPESTIRNHTHVLVGISHTKSHRRMPSSQGDRFNYLSRLYAFSPDPPYQLLARSPPLCFGFPRDEEANAENSDPYAVPTQVKKLELNGKRYDCPNVHFVSGMSEKVDDPSRMIVAYGVNDCVARMVEINKRAFMARLFADSIRSS